MSDKNLTTFLTEWGGQVKELIEPKVKLTPELNIANKNQPTIYLDELYFKYDPYRTSSNYYIVTYNGDGSLSVNSDFTLDSYGSHFRLYVPFSAYIYTNGIYSSEVIITSTETDNYQAKEWSFPCTIEVYTAVTPAPTYLNNNKI